MFHALPLAQSRPTFIPLKEYIPTNNRSEFRNTGRNRLIIDAYNANPTSMAAALENFRQMQAENKMVILGEMRELGKDSTTEHQNIINILDNVNASEIWLVGQEFQYTNRSLLTTANRVFCNVDEVKQELSNLPLKDKMILIKGSNGTRLFELPDYL